MLSLKEGQSTTCRRGWGSGGEDDQNNSCSLLSMLLQFCIVLVQEAFNDSTEAGGIENVMNTNKRKVYVKYIYFERCKEGK